MVDNIEHAYQTALARYGHLRQVTGIDIGPKYTNGQRTDTLAIRVHVVVKRGQPRLLPSERLPTDIGGVPVDVLERNYVPGVEGLQDAASLTAPAAAGRFDPLLPGVSVSHRLCPSGTLGLLVRDRATAAPMLLTNWHVVADSSFAKVGDAVTQPGATDGGRATDAVATLARSILDIDGDAAVATLLASRQTSPAIRTLGRTPTRLRDPKRDDIVVKSGRSTDVTTGRVEGFGTYYPIYRTRDRVGIAGFEIVPLDRKNPANIELSTNGDSGSVWLAKDSDEVLGLHFAGERDPAPGAEVAIACFATRVFERLSVTIP